MSGGIPSGAVGASVAVLLYSAICFILCLLLVLLLISFGEKWTYVTLFSAFTALSTLASIIQQLHYAAAWVIIKEAQYQKAVKSLTHKGLAFGGAAQIVDQVLFFIQFYCYNVMALNVLFWTVALFTGSWGIRSKWLGDYIEWVGTIAKIFSVVFPSLIVSLVNVEAIQNNPAVFIVISYMAMFSSLTMGSILLVLILYKYMKTRRLVSGYGKRGRWWASDDRSQRDVGADYTADTMASGATSSTRRSIYDKALLTRFSLGFIIMAVFEVAIIFFTLIQAHSSSKIAAAGAPDHSLGGTLTDIFLFVPGVTASLVAFLIFGTTKSWRQYRDLVRSGCGLSRLLIKKKKRIRSPENGQEPQGGLEFERLPSLHQTPSEVERQKGKEAESRIRMFTKDSIPDSDSGSNDGASIGPVSVAPPASTKTSLGRVRAASETRTVQFHRPRPVVTRNGRHASSGNIGLASHPVRERQIEDPVIQYESQDWGQRESERYRRSSWSGSGSGSEIEMSRVGDGRRNTIWPQQRDGTGTGMTDRR